MEIGSAVISQLIDRGITTLFGIPGKQTLPMNKAIEERDEISFVMARHETAVSHNAWGYAEASGEMAATVVIPGPGDMNAMNGLKNALNDCTPLLHIAVETEPEIRGGDGIHETPPDTYDNVVKENILVKTPHSTIAELDRAICIARSPPKGPVRIGIPKNFLAMNTPLAAAATADTTTEAGHVPSAAVDEAAALLASARRPLVVAGGGVRSAEAASELRAVAEHLDAPVITTYKGKGTFPEDHELSAGLLCSASSTHVQELVAESDAALGVGTDFDAMGTKNWSYELPEDLVHVTLTSADIGTGYEPTVGLVTDAKQALREINDALREQAIQSTSGAERAQAVRTAEADRTADLRQVETAPLTSVVALEAIREGAPRETVVTADAGGFRLWTVLTFPTYAPRDYVNPGSWATMGTGLPSAIGAKTANPERQVLTIVGDGGLMMAVHELHTLVEEGIDLTVVVLNNNDYAIISEEGEHSYQLPEHKYGWTDSPISFATVAEGFGLDAEHVETAAALKTAVAQALESAGPKLIEVPTDPGEPQAGERMSK